MKEGISPKTTEAKGTRSTEVPAWVLRIPIVGKLYVKYERYVPIIIFVTGFAWDSLTMTRVDSLADNLILAGYLTALGVMIFYAVRKQMECARPKWVCRLESYFPWAMQFAFGSLFSGYVVFYFKSVSWTSTQFFFIVLVILLVGNEFLQDRLLNTRMLAVLYSFALLSFLAFCLPVILKRVGTEIFLLAGVISLGISSMVFLLAYGIKIGRWKKEMTSVLAFVVVTYVLVNSLYFANLIPPVPLGLKSGGIYHSVRRTGSGYEVKFVRPPYWRVWKQWDDPFYLSQDEFAYCFTSIFAPPKVRVPVVHVWSWYSAFDGWHETDRIGFEVSGGREGGYRGFSRKQTLWPGKWRVQVETNQGRILGEVDFAISASPDPHPPLESRIIR
jgi:hypothetical protein